MNNKNTIADILFGTGIVIIALGAIGTIIIASGASYRMGPYYFFFGAFCTALSALMIFALREIIVLLNDTKTYMKIMAENSPNISTPPSSNQSSVKMDDLPKL